MAQIFSSREELKRDPLQEWIKMGLDWIAGHRQVFFSALGTVALLIVVITFIISNLRNLRRQAWERYSAGQNWIYANNPDNAMNFFNEVITNYSRTPAAIYSLLAKADLLYQQKKYPEAIEAYKQCLDKKPQRVVMPFVLEGLGSAQEDSNDFLGAIETYKSFLVEFSDHYLAPKVYESLGRAYEFSHNPDAAKEAYAKIMTMFPATPWNERARARYQTLAPQPFQSTPENLPPSSAQPGK